MFSFQELASQHTSSLQTNQPCNLPNTQNASHVPITAPTAGYGSPQVSFPISFNGYPDVTLAPVKSSELAPVTQDSRLIALQSSLGTRASGLAVVNSGFDSLLASSGYLTFGSDAYSKSSFVMEDDFTWLFDEPSIPSSSAAYSSWTGMVPSYLDATQLQNQFGVDETTNGTLLGSDVASDQPMHATRTLSSDKVQELQHLMVTRFNEAAYLTVANRKDTFFEGNMHSDNHILSVRMMRTYFESYWCRFHPQLPILHRPAFVANQAPNLLLLAVIAIGATTLDHIHGPNVVGTVSELANFIIWHLRWEVCMDAEFQTPTKLWVFQVLLLIEVHEKMYSTRLLHDRAHIHHDATLALMRRGGLFIGRYADACSVSSADHRQVCSAARGSNMTPDFALDESWTHWIEAEATRRVVFAAFMLDSTHAAMFGQPAKMTTHELRLPLPCDEALWSATSVAEVVRVQSSLQANGVKPVMFLDGLKGTLEERTMQTNAFGRSIIMTGLLSVLWHMNQRELRDCSLDLPHSLGSRDNRRSAFMRAFDNWRQDFDDALGQNGKPTPTLVCEYQAWPPTGEDSFSKTRGVLYSLGHIASRIDIVECQSFAGAIQPTGQLGDCNANVNLEKMTERWATEASAREATFYALKFLSECLLDGASEDGDNYSGRDDYNLNRPWVIYMAALVVWCYGFALDGPISLPPALTTAAEQRRDMLEFLHRVGGVRCPDDLRGMQRRNRCLGLLMILRNGFVNTRWELLAEAANLLGSCIAKLRG